MTRASALLCLLATAAAATSCTQEQTDAWRGLAEDIEANTQVFHIAFLGDSYAAGEGAPERRVTDPDGLWWSNRQCHRSGLNGRISAAEALDTRPDSILVAIEFIDVSCSGATVDIGLLGGNHRGVPQRGTVQDPVPPQVDQVAHWMQLSSIDSLDAVVLSVGGNDVAFPRVVAECLSPIGGCRNNAALAAVVERGEQDTPEFLGFRNLPDAYARLDTRIRSTLRPRHILITGYPDPLRDQNANFCGGYDENFTVLPEHLTYGEPLPVAGIAHWLHAGGSISHIDAAESQWVYNNLVARLNETIAEVAEELGWVFVGSFDEYTRRHGYCSREPFFNTLRRSWEAQGDVFGTAHPNANGYLVTLHSMQKGLVETLGIRVVPPPFIRPDRWGTMVSQNAELQAGFVPANGTDSVVARGVIGRTVRVRAQLFPSAHDATGVSLVASRNRPLSSAFDEEVSTVTAQHDNRFGFEHVYFADLPFSAQTNACDWINYRWVVHYSDGSATRASASETMTFQATHSPAGSVSLCDPVPG